MIASFSSAIFRFGLFAIAVLSLDQAQAEESEIDFNRDIRPIFRQHCTGCHGGVKAAGGISFVYKDSALAEGDSGERPIVPGDAEASELIRRVLADEGERMPPDDHGPALSPPEVETLKRWINEGANWSEVWSLQPIENPPAPAVSKPDWPRRTLDKFVLAKLDVQGLAPSQPASPAEWLRRVTLDLTGVPPSLDEYNEFVKVEEANPEAAKAAVVDRLLQSSRFGERWATMWLDLARYSDTHGFEKDLGRTIWPWRDWVIRAFNQDMPFDEFTRKQIAGDLLPNATADDVLATAFHRNTMNNTEGGTNDEEFRYAAVVDRVNTIWTTWQATTFGCVRCHAHPYDPYTHEEYYQFLSLFDSTEDCDQNDDFPRLGFSADKPQEAFELQQQIARTRLQRNSLGQRVVEQVTDWHLVTPVNATASAGTLAITSTGHLQAGGTLPVGVTYTLTLDKVSGVTALRFHLHPDSDNPLKWPERGQVISQVEVFRVTTDKDNTTKEVQVPLRTVIADYLAGPFDPVETLDGGPGGFGSFPAMTGPRQCVVLFEEPLPADCDSLQVRVKQSAQANGGSQACPLRHFHVEATSSTELAAWAKSQELTAFDQAIADAKQKLSKLSLVQVPVLVQREDASMRPTRLLQRGDATSPGERMYPGVPKVLRSAELKVQTRLELANWMCNPSHPLTSRTLVNRLWYEMFGSGIVETVEDMGTSGTEPSHPELLDHLSYRLQGEFKWSIKSLLREIALSATYGQTAKADQERLEKDLFNRWLARGPRVRLTAEMLRDQSLAVSGLLSDKAFGPPVYPPQPDGIWSSVYNGETWRTSTGEDRYRRAIYTFQKRTSGYPGFLTFDAPNREVCSARRLVTNTPLQSLATLNDPAFLEMARAYAQRMQSAGSTVAEQIRQGVQWLTLEVPDEALVQRLVQLHDAALVEYTQDPELAKSAGNSAAEAALVLVANAIFNLDVFLVR